VSVSKESQVRDVVPFKAGKRQSTARKLNLDIAGGTALEEALERQQNKDISHQYPPLPTSTHHSPPVPIQDNITEHPIAPARDYNKRANSLERDAMPAGLFPGSTFKVYNALYLRSRGAVVPARRVRAARRDLLDWTGIKNLKTIDSHIRYLMSKSLIIRNWEPGSNEGSEYEVFLPEEVLPPVTTTPHQSPVVPTSQKTGSGYTQFLGSGGDSQTIENKDTFGLHQTFIRLDRKIDDDEAFAKSLREAERELTGKESSAQVWEQLFELLTAELKIAAARTTVSSVPAFLTEHLRRRLWKLEKKQVEEQTAQEKGTGEAVDAAKCPDCGSTGWWYPEGQEKGVARCLHQKLLNHTKDPAT
jgi:hypothetical protein